MKRERGFTLIELLVVIAIIGLLSSVVVASLNSARGKGADTAIKANLSNARAEAETFYDNGGTYDAVCAATGTNVIGDSGVAAAGALSGTYSAVDTANATATVVVCHDSATGWAMLAALKTAPTTGFCVDAAGTATVVAITSLDTDNDVTCN